MMKIAALCLCVVAASASMTVQFRPMEMLADQTVALETRFEAFETMFAKDYADAEARTHAAMAFAANDAFIKAHNAGNHTFTVGHNEFSDLTWDEFKAQYVSGMASNPNLRRAKNYNLELVDAPAPDAVDWVAKGAVTPVKNQQQCGSCWAFSTTGSTEGAYQIATGSLISLSEQELVDCANSYGNEGCNGGLMDDGFKYIEAKGLATEASYPYTARNGQCQDSSKTSVVTVTGYTDVPQGSSSGLKAAAAIGPVSVAIEADKQAFQLYKSGVFTSESCGTKLDHGVLVVGYGTDSASSLPYWKVKNSWGATWGDSGYIRIKSGENLCGITNSASYPTGAKKAAPGPAPGPSPPPAPPSPSPPAPGGKTHYGNPEDGCMSDEQAVRVQGLSGDFCSPDCASAACPTDIPSGVTAHPQCALQSTSGDKKCALLCSPSDDFASLRAGDAQCGEATCQPISGVGICTYGAGPSPGPSPPPPPPPSPPSPPAPPAGKTHYGDPEDGCMSDEQAVRVQGLSGDFCSPDCASAACPTDIPSGVTAHPQCALQSTSGDKKCALLCSPSDDFASLRAGDAQCGKATCQPISGVGICTYGAGPSPGPSPPGPAGCTAVVEAQCAMDVLECQMDCSQGAKECIQCLGAAYKDCCPCVKSIVRGLPCPGDETEEVIFRM